jgi:hypothetical protein
VIIFESKVKARSASLHKMATELKIEKSCPAFTGDFNETLQE